MTARRIFSDACSARYSGEVKRMCLRCRKSATGFGLGHVAPIEDDLAGVAGAHRVEALFIVAPVHPVGDDAGDVEAALEHDSHLVPGLVHLAPVDAANGELVEDDLVPVDGDIFGRDA